jgi:hypothetical protein
MREQGADGAEGNARLTGAVGLLLLVVLFVEGITILQVRQLITLHIFVGLVLIPPTVLKFASTLYRFVRYYANSPDYVRHGPPAPLLRWTAPLLVIMTGSVLVTGVALLVVGPQQQGLILTAHKLTFAFWFALMALHVLGHVKDAVLLSRWDWWPRVDGSVPQEKRPRGKGQRRGLVLASLVAGVALALALLPLASPWTSRPIRHDGAPQTAHPTVAVRLSSWP